MKYVTMFLCTMLLVTGCAVPPAASEVVLKTTRTECIERDPPVCVISGVCFDSVTGELIPNVDVTVVTVGDFDFDHDVDMVDFYYLQRTPSRLPYETFLRGMNGPLGGL